MVKAGHNGVDPKVLARWTGEVLRVHQELDDKKIEHMNQCRSIRERLPDLYEAAKDSGLNLKAFKAHIKVERAKIAFDKACENAVPEDDEDQEAFEALRAVAEAGDLFDAAVKANEKKKGNGKKAADDDDKDVRPRHLRDLEQQRIEENIARLEKGIAGLPGAEATEA